MTRVQIAGLLALKDLRTVVLGRDQDLGPDGGIELTLQDIERLQHFYLAMTGSALPVSGPIDLAVPDLPERLLCLLAADIMDLMGQSAAETLFARRGPLAVRAASRLRAEEQPPAVTVRHAAQGGDVVIGATRQPYAKFFAVEERDISWRRFDGSFGTAATRAAFISGDAVTVLPYDPLRDRVLVVEQFRAGPQARGDAQPWQIEPIAGRIDPGETPEAAARREAEEEAGLTLGPMHRVAGYYPSPGILSEFLYSYVAVTDLPDGVAGVFGLDSEQEDIRGHLLSFTELVALIGTGEVCNAPLILTAFWLERHRVALRAEVAGQGGSLPP